MDLTRYTAAYEAVVAAQAAYQAAVDAGEDGTAEAATLAAATTELRAAEAEHQTEVDAAWQIAIGAVQAAKATLVDAMRTQAAVEAEVGAAARARHPLRPVLSVPEMERVEAAAAAVTEARAALTAAQAAFKAGVSPTDLAEVSV